jgi:hypothetical protein
MNVRSKQKGEPTMSNSLTYSQSGDYLYPNLQLTPTETQPLNKYGRMRRTFLQENKPLLYSNLVLSGKLFPHLWEIQQTVRDRMEQLMTELLAKNPAPNKETNQMGWVQHMNALKAQAEEMVLTELIYN